MPDQLFVNGKIFTGVGENDFASAMRVSGAQIGWVGQDDDPVVEQFRADAAGEVIDLGGATVLPGLIDVHQHPTFTALWAAGACLLPPLVGDIDAVVEALSASPEAVRAGVEPGPGEAPVWIQGWGYDESGLAEGRQLTRRDLDRVSTSQPVFVRRSDAHSGSCNSVALQLAGITAATRDPAGGVFGREESGEPNGILTEIAAVEAVLAHCPPPSRDDLVAALVQVGDHLSECGLVAVGDLASMVIDDPLGAMRAAQGAGLAQRVNLYLNWDGLRADPPVLSPQDTTGRVRVAGVKVFMDGTMSNRTAWVSRPYRDSLDERGIRASDDDELRAACDYARAYGIQLAVHAMGDSAMEAVARVLADEQPWLDDVASVRIEHATLLRQDVLDRFADATMTFAIVSHAIFYFAEYAAYSANLTAYQLLDTYPLLRLYEGIPAAALSSDAPCTAWADSDSVFRSVQTAVDRTALGGQSLGFDQALTVAQALLLYTARAVKCAPFPGLGQVQPGSCADFVVLDADVFTVPTNKIASVGIARTYIEGECVYATEAAVAQVAASVD